MSSDDPTKKPPVAVPDDFVRPPRRRAAMAANLRTVAAALAAGGALPSRLPDVLRPPTFSPPVRRPETARGPITCTVSVINDRPVVNRLDLRRARDGRLYSVGVVNATTLRRAHKKPKGKAARRAEKAARRADKAAAEAKRGQ